MTHSKKKPGPYKVWQLALAILRIIVAILKLLDNL